MGRIKVTSIKIFYIFWLGKVLKTRRYPPYLRSIFSVSNLAGRVWRWPDIECGGWQ
jgi:hypothetical protein